MGGMRVGVLRLGMGMGVLLHHLGWKRHRGVERWISGRIETRAEWRRRGVDLGGLGGRCGSRGGRGGRGRMRMLWLLLAPQRRDEL
jgi:hypothetical protein